LPLQRSPQNQLRKKKRKLMLNLLSQPLPSQPRQHLPLLRQQRLLKVSLLRKTTRKSLLRSNPNDLEDGDYEINDEVTFGRNRQAENFGKIVEEELSDYVKFRLWLARQIALAKYKEVHG
jgi:hypothetical protein